MTVEQIKSNIKESLQAFEKGNLTEKSFELFEKLGYVTERRAPLHKPTFAEFNDTYIGDKKFDEAKAKISDWKYIDLLFQLSKEEVQKQANLFDTKQVDRTVIETYLFFAIELSQNEYSRTELSVITREVNRLFPMPAMILFKHGKTLTVSAINRRLHKRDESKDVLEKVTLIKDIVIENPHRAHIEILFDISFDELRSKHQFTNFVELHNAWQKTLDTKELNKRFYSELFNWYLWAVRSVNFPNNVNDDKDDMVYNSESVIRLLTRLIFVWFIKEKNLVPDSLFELTKLKDILKDFKPQSEETSVYYRAILQNLFFATLNTPMDKDITAGNKDEQRRFINTLPKISNDQYLDQTKYRYQNYFTKPEKAIELFSTIPFLNGGLFECLDSIVLNPETRKLEEVRFDGFSSTEKRQAFVPDKLFFAEEFILDLNSEYGTKGKKYKVEGLINILDSYKFTITENTPLEEEIALDPELLGKVFENLLASYNPETQTTARKQTGSFYTPREIVNYMVDESLIAYFKQNLDNSVETETKLRDLFSFVGDLPEFTKPETDVFIRAISEVKILDPACGSGAFPMGVLHRLVDLLNKLDPDNKKWNELQKQRAIAETTVVFDSGDKDERSIRLEEINKAFDLSMNYPDYARKLFLIENCIYGVDIQQIAIQISKLRFFISLIVDQKVDDNKPNRNILSMPNLETKFVAANTLIGIDKPQQMALMAGDVERLEKELGGIRSKIFFTRKYSEKKTLKKKEKEKREELQTALTQSGYTVNVAGQMAGWNPFDPIKSAKFFDPETMFGFNLGFDVIIGNPPYVEFKNLNKNIKETLKNYVTTKGKYDLYIPFIERPKQFLNKKGVLTYICPTRFLQRDYGKDIRKFIALNFRINQIIDFSDIQIFENATTYTGVFIFQNITDSFDYSFILKQPKKTEPFLNKTELLKQEHSNEFIDITKFDSTFLQNAIWIFNNDTLSPLIAKIRENTMPLEEIW
jgi:adenine-specific DNA-methyltransferase